MNYKDHYNKLIDRAKTRQIPAGYTETHHVIPRCMGGTDGPDNLVVLTAREHFIAHLLLAKIYSDTPGLVYAAMMMCVEGNGQTGRSKNRQYEWLKKRYSGVVSENQKGKNNSQYGTMWITDGTSEKKIDKTADIPDAWYRGRLSSRKMIKCPTCNTMFKPRNRHHTYCSTKCVRRESTHDGREDELLQLVGAGMSINAALKKMGFLGAVGSHYTWAKNVINSASVSPDTSNVLKA